MATLVSNASENYDVKFKLDNVWDTGYNATITITNTSDSVIENWCLTFPFNVTISNIWNATVSKTHEDFYVIKNAGWNQDIAVGGSVSFGITVYEAFTEFPEYYTIIGNQVETKSEDYTIDYKVTEDWGDGYKAEVTITNNKDTAIEDWRLSFSYGDNLITQIWNAVILGNAEGKYELSCETYNQNIAPGASITLGFMVEPGCSGNMMENIKLTEVETDLSDGIAILFGYMDEGSNELVLSTMASMETDRYEFFMSFDDGDFVKVGETAENEFSYAFENTFAKVEIYAVGYDTYGLPAETNHIFVECTDGVYTVILPDTDGDELWDGKEVISEVRKMENYFYEDMYGRANYYLLVLSYPNMIDSDMDGINDKEDNCPLNRGVYSWQTGDIVVGKLTIVSSSYNYVAGHSYLLYHSYIDDSLGLYGLTGEYEISVDAEKKASYKYVDSSWETIEAGEYITLGNSSLTMDSNFEIIETKFFSQNDMDASGIYYNREIAAEINEGKAVYDKNSALSMEVTKEQIDDVLAYHRSRNYYNVVTNNCSVLAIKSWNRVSKNEKFDVTISPVVLKCYIMNRRGAFSVDLLELWGIK